MRGDPRCDGARWRALSRNAAEKFVSECIISTLRSLIFPAIIAVFSCRPCLAQPGCTGDGCFSGQIGAVRAQAAAGIADAKARAAKAPPPAPADDASSQGAWFDNAALTGHSLQLLTNGRSAYDARIALIRSAHRSIYLSAYSFSWDNVGKNIVNELCQKAERGVDVRLILDSHGASGLGDNADYLRDCGAWVMFDDTAKGTITDLLYVIHEKLLIVDGESVILGGSGYANRYYNYGRDDPQWQDMDAEIKGPAACWFQRKFAQNWAGMIDRALRARTDAMGAGRPSEDWVDFYFGGRELLSCEGIMHGGARVLPAYSNPFLSGKRPLLDAHIAAIAASRGTIRLYAPYFVPNDEFRDALIAARRHGVAVTVITNSPASTDESVSMMTASYAKVRALIDAGVDIRLWTRPSVMHRKGGIYGGRWAYIGSDNLDNRGVDYSSESLAFTDDPAFVRGMTEEFAADLALTIPLTKGNLEEYLETKSFPRRFIARLMSAFF
jgi:cardiolipin synthase A/B